MTDGDLNVVLGMVANMRGTRWSVNLWIALWFDVQ